MNANKVWTVSMRLTGHTQWHQNTYREFNAALKAAHRTAYSGDPNIAEVVLYNTDAEPVFHWQRRAMRQEG